MHQIVDDEEAVAMVIWSMLYLFMLIFAPGGSFSGCVERCIKLLYIYFTFLKMTVISK